MQLAGVRYTEAVVIGRTWSMMQSSAIRNVIFDFGGVLLRWEPQQIIEAFYADPGLRDSLSRNVFRHADWLEMDRGSLAEDAAVQRFATRMNRPAKEMLALLQAVKESLVPIPGTLELVHGLAARGVPVYGLSNMSASMFTYLRARYDHWKLFQGIVISGEIKLMKPDLAIFEYISRQHHLEPSQTLFIDDHFPNIEAAKKLGFRTMLFDGPEGCVRHVNAFLAGHS